MQKMMSNDHLTSGQLTQLQVLLNKHVDVFANSDLDLGCTDIVKHRINLIDEVPFKDRARRLPPALYTEVRNHLKEMMDAGVIR